MAAMAQRTEMERGFGYIGVFFFFTLFGIVLATALHWSFLCVFFLFFASCSSLCVFFLLTLCCDWSIGHRGRHLGIARYDVSC